MKYVAQFFICMYPASHIVDDGLRALYIFITCVAMFAADIIIDVTSINNRNGE